MNTGFPIPSQSGLRCHVSFKNRTGVHVVTLGAAKLPHCKVEISELFLDDVVVVLIPGIAGDLIGWIRVGRSRVVVEGKADNSLRAGKNVAGVGSALGIALKPFHVTGLTFRRPAQKLIGMPRPAGRRNPAIVKAELGGNELYVTLGDDGIHGDRT